MITRTYVGILTKRLKDDELDRYFYPLVLIEEAQGKLTPKELADQLLMDKVAVARIVEHLSEKGLITREKNPDDKRSYYLNLTAKGAKKVPKIKCAIRQVNSLCLQGLSANTVQQLEEAIGQMLCNLSQQPRDEYTIHFNKVEDHEE